MIPGREVTRIFISDVKNRIENDGLTDDTECDEVLKTTLVEAHERGIEVYALFAVSDDEFSEKEMADYANQFNTACGDEWSYFDGVAVNNEYFSKVKDCDDESEKLAQLQFLTDIQTTVENAAPLPLHFSVSWNWDCCSCSSDSYEKRELLWDGNTKSALEHMVNIVDSVDVQVAYNKPSVMEERATNAHQYWDDIAEKSSTSAFYVLAYANPNSICQLSFAPHAKGSETATDECFIGDRTESGMYTAFDEIESNLPGAIGGIHFMGGVYSSGITDDWPKHDSPTCPLHQKWKAGKNKCVNKCAKKGGKVWDSDKCVCACPICRKWKNKKCRNRCNSAKKWNETKQKCIKKDSGKEGWIWDKSGKTCVSV